MQIRLRHWLQFHAALVCAALAATGCVHQAIAAVPAKASVPAVTESAARVPFGSTALLKVGHSITFADGLIVALEKVDDSRCPVVSCVWAGELAPQLTVHGGKVGASQTVTVGTSIHNRKRALAGYEFALIEATTDSATLVVTKAAAIASKP